MVPRTFSDYNFKFIYKESRKTLNNDNITVAYAMLKNNRDNLEFLELLDGAQLNGKQLRVIAIGFTRPEN
jgi:hypothetical protein